MGKKAKAEAVKAKKSDKEKEKETALASADTPEPEKDIALQPPQDEPPLEGTINGKVKYESSLPRDEAIAYFEAIVKGLKKGQIQFKQGDQNVIVAPAEYLEVEVKAARKGQKEKVSFEISWRTDAHADLTVA